MDAQFIDRILTCSDCHAEFIFTAGEQLFFHDKQFKNDPKRCKPCKSRRSGLSAAAAGLGMAAAGLARTETRTNCSDCGIDTTVPFKPTQGRPVLCRQCFQLKTRTAGAAGSLPPGLSMDSGSSPSLSPNPAADPAGHFTASQTASALTSVSANGSGAVLSNGAAVLAAVSMASAAPHSGVATAADLASIASFPAQESAAYVSRLPAGVHVASRLEAPARLSSEPFDA